MGKDISELFGKGGRETNVMERFAAAIKGKDASEVRIIEMTLLKPTAITPYTGPTMGRSDYEKRSITMAFKSEEDVDRLGKYIRINKFSHNNTYDVGILMEVLRLLESGRLRWSSKKNRLTVVSGDQEIRLL